MTDRRRNPDTPPADEEDVAKYSPFGVSRDKLIGLYEGYRQRNYDEDI
jgi:hypothetical protein